MKELFLKYKKLIIIFLGLVSVILLIIGSLPSKPPKIILLKPQDLSKNIDLRTPLTYSIDLTVNIDDLKITSTPSNNMTLSFKDKNTLIAEHKLAFQPSTKYTFEIFWKNKLISTNSLTTTKSQEDPNLIEKMNNELARDYPLAQKLPLKTTNYRVVYSSPLTLEIELLNANTSATDIVNEVKSWVTKNGGDVSIHKFVIANP